MLITGFIENLIVKKQHMEAIRFICAFEMVNQFPPGPILRDYLSGSKSAAKKIRRRNSIEGLVCFAGFLLQYVISSLAYDPTVIIFSHLKLASRLSL